MPSIGDDLVQVVAFARCGVKSMRQRRNVTSPATFFNALNQEESDSPTLAKVAKRGSSPSCPSERSRSRNRIRSRRSKSSMKPQYIRKPAAPKQTISHPPRIVRITITSPSNSRTNHATVTNPPLQSLDPSTDTPTITPLSPSAHARLRLWNLSLKHWHGGIAKLLDPRLLPKRPDGHVKPVQQWDVELCTALGEAVICGTPEEVNARLVRAAQDRLEEGAVWRESEVVRVEDVRRVVLEMRELAWAGVREDLEEARDV